MPEEITERLAQPRLRRHVGQSDERIGAELVEEGQTAATPQFSPIGPDERKMLREPFDPKKRIDDAQVGRSVPLAGVDGFHKITSRVAETSQVRDAPVVGPDFVKAGGSVGLQNPAIIGKRSVRT